MRILIRLAALLSFVAIVTPAGRLQAEDFRIETKVFSVKEKDPVSQNITLFHSGVVYDYLSNPTRVAVFDQPHGRFVLLDPTRKVKTYINTDQVLTFCGVLRTWAINGPNEFLKFCGNPEFKTDYSEKSGELTLASDYLTYKIQTTRGKTSEAAHQVREFSDWYTRLNSMTNPGSTPPFARLAVNEELDRHGLIASQVQLTIPPQFQLGGKAMAMRSEHTIAWRLLARDLNRISETGDQLAKYESVTFDVFMREQVTKK